MLPQIDPEILKSNPRFAKLHTQLCIKFLNPDGSTKNRPSSTEEDELRQNLESAQRATLQRTILRTALSDLPYSTDELPDELREATMVINSLLDTPSLHMSDLNLLQSDVDQFHIHIRPIAQALSKRLTQLLTNLSSTISPTVHIPSNSLPLHLTDLHSTLCNTTTTLFTLRSTIPSSTSVLFSLHTQLLATIIRLLEQVMHGTTARNAKARSEHLQMVAASIEAKLQILEKAAETQLYTPKLTQALTNYDADLEKRKWALSRKKELLERNLKAYQTVGTGQEMIQLARRYRELGYTAERLREGIRRLENDI